jgi:hypothetical protein
VDESFHIIGNACIENNGVQLQPSLLGGGRLIQSPACLPAAHDLSSKIPHELMMSVSESHQIDIWKAYRHNVSGIHREVPLGSNRGRPHLGVQLYSPSNVPIISEES